MVGGQSEIIPGGARSPPRPRVAPGESNGCARFPGAPETGESPFWSKQEPGATPPLRGEQFRPPDQKEFPPSRSNYRAWVTWGISRGSARSVPTTPRADSFCSQELPPRGELPGLGQNPKTGPGPKKENPKQGTRGGRKPPPAFSGPGPKPKKGRAGSVPSGGETPKGENPF
mgnify:CR=1 FL=1